MIELYRVQNSGLAIARYTVDAEPPLPNRECASYEKRYMTISDYSKHFTNKVGSDQTLKTVSHSPM